MSRTRGRKLWFLGAAEGTIFTVLGRYGLGGILDGVDSKRQSQVFPRDSAYYFNKSLFA